MTMEHLRTLLDSPRDTQSLYVVCELLARGLVPNSIRDIVRIGRLTALQKPSGGVRGFVAGDVIRRVVARTIAQQLSEAVEIATAPSSTRSQQGVGVFDLTREHVAGPLEMPRRELSHAICADVLWAAKCIFVAG